MSAAAHAGSCLCGSVRYRVEGGFDRVTHCHCSMCRKSHGAAFATYATVSASQLSIEDDTGTLTWYRSSPTAERGFCTGCGASLFWRDETREPGLVAFSLGTVDTPLGEVEIRDIFVESKADWTTPRFASDTPPCTKLHKQWTLTLRHAAAARCYLPERFAGDEFRTLDSDVRTYLHHNEFLLAVEAMEIMGNTLMAPKAFWDEICLAYASMGLQDRANEIAMKAIAT